MNKNILLPIWLIVMIIFFSWIYLNLKKKNIKKEKIIQPIVEIEKKPEKKKLEIGEKKKRISTIKKKLAIKWLIAKWELDIKNQEYRLALTKYLKIHTEVPNDKNTIKKLWDIYYDLKNYPKSYSYYSKIKNYQKLDRKKLFLTMISFHEPTNTNIDGLIQELDTYWLDIVEYFYYKNLLSCTSNFNKCIEKFETYISKNDVSNYELLTDIKNALEAYKNFWSEDKLYKKALIIWAFFKHGYYPIVISTSKKVLKIQKDYKAVLQMNAKSFFELWDYINAKINQLQYISIAWKSPEWRFFLWLIYEKLKEYSLSTIHFKKANELWYDIPVNANERILYNYYKIGDTENLLKTFQEIINKKQNLSFELLNMAIYYHIINQKYIEAEKIAIIWIKNLERPEIFYSYISWIYLEKPYEKNNLKKSDYYYNKAVDIKKTHPIINFIEAKIELKKWNTKKAYDLFTKVSIQDINWDYWNLALEELNEIVIINKNTNDTNWK
jgi:hypothetical protein